MDAAPQLFDTLASMPGWLLACLLVGSYLATTGVIRYIARPAITGPLDPLNIELVMSIGPALVGFLLVPILTTSASESFFWILLFLLGWLFIIRGVGRPASISLQDQMGVTFPKVLLSLTVAITVADVVVNMILPGKIPLFTEGGAATRFESTSNSRLLTWLTFGTAPLGGAVYALTQNAKVRKLAVIAVGIQAVAGLLFASKGGILVLVLILLRALFVAKARKEHARYKKLRTVLLYTCILIGPLIPIYLGIIGVGSGTLGIFAVGLRFLNGLDQLMLASQFNMLHGKPYGSLIGASIVELQLMPFFKAFLGSKFTYSNIGQYVIEAATGVYIDGPFTFPNSNLILETIFTSGKYLGGVVFALEMWCFYRARYFALGRPVKPWSIVLISATVFSPTSLFSDGQGWMTNTILVSVVVLLALALTWVWRALAQITHSAAVEPSPSSKRMASG